MPHISRNKLSTKVEKELVATLEIILTKLNKEESMKTFLLSLLSPTERLMLAKRVAMIILLKEDLPESHIAATLHVTRGTVSRMRLFLEARGEGYELALQILQKEASTHAAKEILLKLVAYTARAAGGRVKPTIL